MKIVSVHKVVHLLACVVLAVQFVAPGALAARVTDQISLSDFLCAPSGEISEDAKAAAASWSNLVHKPTPADKALHDHCPLCVIAQIALLDGLRVERIIHQHWTAPESPESAIVVAHPAQGPPLGLRAPPKTH